MTDFITPADKRIWDLSTGSALTCSKSVVMEDDGVVAFTVVKTYSVVSVHPIAEPSFVVLINDQSKQHKMYGEHIAEYFTG